MIISHRLKFAYFRCPKTGSTTTEIMLRMCGVFTDQDICTLMPLVRFPSWNVPELFLPLDRTFNEAIPLASHMTITEAVNEGYITLEQLREYNVVATIREPFDRYVSMFRHANPIAVPQILQTLIKRNYDFGIAQRPQIDYFTYEGEVVASPMHFDNFDVELRRILVSIGGYDFPLIPRMNYIRSRDRIISVFDYFDDESRALLRERLAEDFALYEQFKKV